MRLPITIKKWLIAALIGSGLLGQAKIHEYCDEHFKERWSYYWFVCFYCIMIELPESFLVIEYETFLTALGVYFEIPFYRMKNSLFFQ